MKKILFHILFLIIVLGVLFGEIIHLKWFDYAFKPMIMIWIATYFLSYSKNTDKKVVTLAIAAFTLSWAGDIFLMFGNKGFQFFILGLASFLVAQIFYLFLYLRTINLSGKKSFLKKRPYLLFFYIAYGLIIYTILYNQLDTTLRIAVLFYMLALLSMSAMALNRFGNGHPLSFSLVFAGSILFVISDSFIAINRFLTPVPNDRIIIMTTYIGAQYLIMRGLLKQYE